MRWFRPKIPDKRVRLAFIAGMIAMLLSIHVLDALGDDSKSFDWIGEGFLVAALCVLLGQLALTEVVRENGASSWARMNAEPEGQARDPNEEEAENPQP